MKEEVKIALSGIQKFVNNNLDMKKFVDLLAKIIVNCDATTINLAKIFCTHDKMQRFLPMFLNTNEQKWLITQYEFLQQMEMSINGAGKLQLVNMIFQDVDRKNKVYQLKRIFLLKDGKNEEELIDYIKNDMLADDIELLMRIDIKNLTWADMVLIVESIMKHGRLDESLLFRYELEDKIVSNTPVTIWK